MQEDVFHEVADEFINLANELSDDWAQPLLSAAIMYAAARYNAFNFQSVDGNDGNREDAIRYYTEQYSKMLRENMQELPK
jgi:hypothetical protein